MLGFIKHLTNQQIVRFMAIGIVTTILYVLLVSVILSYKILQVADANAVTYAVATAFSYTMNTIWSFDQKVTSKNALRFIAVSLGGCVLSYSIAAIMDNAGYHYLIGICVVVITVPVYTYVLHSHWTYAT